MRLKFTALAALAAIMALTVTALASGGGMPNMPGMSHSHAQTASASDLRSLLDRQLGQHAVLAMNATNAGVKGSKAFPAAAKTLDQNSVALSKTIASVSPFEATWPIILRCSLRFGAS